MASYSYAKDVLKGRFYLAENFIKKYPEYAFEYAKNIIKGPWKDCEEYISQDYCYSYKYSKYVLKNRFILGEKNSLDQNSEYMYYYAKNIIKGKLPEELHNKMLALALDNQDKFVVEYFTLIKNKNEI